MSTFDPLSTLKLSVQRALIGEVTDRLFGVTCGIRGTRVQIRAYFSGKVTPVDIERVSFLGGEVIADFPEQYKIEESTLSADDGETYDARFLGIPQGEIVKGGTRLHFSGKPVYQDFGDKFRVADHSEGTRR